MARDRAIESQQPRCAPIMVLAARGPRFGLDGCRLRRPAWTTTRCRTTMAARPVSRLSVDGCHPAVISGACQQHRGTGHSGEYTLPAQLGHRRIDRARPGYPRADADTRCRSSPGPRCDPRRRRRTAPTPARHQRLRERLKHRPGRIDINVAALEVLAGKAPPSIVVGQSPCSSSNCRV